MEGGGASLLATPSTHTPTYNTNCLTVQDRTEVVIRYTHQLGEITPRYPKRPMIKDGATNIVHQAIRCDIGGEVWGDEGCVGGVGMCRMWGCGDVGRCGIWGGVGYGEVWDMGRCGDVGRMNKVRGLLDGSVEV